MICIIMLIALVFVIRYSIKEKDKPVPKTNIDNHLAELEVRWENEKKEVEEWLDSKRMEHGQESARFSGWTTSSKGIVFFDKAGVLYIEGVQYQYSSIEDCKLVVIYEEEDDVYFDDEMEYENELRKRKNDVIGSVVIGSAIGGTVGAAIGAMVAESDTGNFIARYLPKSNGSREINHYEIKIAFKEQQEYIVFNKSSYDELDAERTFNYLLRIIEGNQKEKAMVQEEDNIADKLLRVAELKEKGLITEEEFKKIKAKLLS